MRARLTLPLVVAGLLGCTSGFDRNDQIVNSLRILGIGEHIADTSGMNIDWADADVGDTVHFEALVANPTGLSTVTVTWLACLPIPGQPQPCTDDKSLRDPVSIIRLSDDPANTGVLKLGTGTAFDYVVPDDLQPVLQALLTRADMQVNAECALYTQIPLLVIAQDNANGAVFAAVKNLRLSPWKEIAQANDPAYAYYVRNANPVIQAMNIPTTVGLCDGETLAAGCLQDSDCSGGATCQDHHCRPGGVFPDGQQSICLALAADQSYYTCGLQGPQINQPTDPPNVPEQSRVTWYVSGGSLSDYAAPMNGSGGSLTSRTYTYFTRPAGPFTIYGVVRDGRDGETWIAQDFQ